MCDDGCRVEFGGASLDSDAGFAVFAFPIVPSLKGLWPHLELAQVITKWRAAVFGWFAILGHAAHGSGCRFEAMA